MIENAGTAYTIKTYVLILPDTSFSTRREKINKKDSSHGSNRVRKAIFMYSQYTEIENIHNHNIYSQLYGKLCVLKKSLLRKRGR